MSAILSPCDSCSTAHNSFNFDNNILNDYLANRLNMLNDYSVRLLIASTGQTHLVKLSSVLNLINTFISTDFSSLTVTHLMVFIYQNRQTLLSTSDSTDISLNQINLFHLGKVFRYRDTTWLADLNIVRNPTIHLIINNNIPYLNLSIDSVLRDQDTSVTFIEAMVKKLRTVKNSIKKKNLASDLELKSRSRNSFKKMLNI